MGGVTFLCSLYIIYKDNDFVKNEILNDLTNADS